MDNDLVENWANEVFQYLVDELNIDVYEPNNGIFKLIHPNHPDVPLHAMLIEEGIKIMGCINNVNELNQKNDNHSKLLNKINTVVEFLKLTYNYDNSDYWFSYVIPMLTEIDGTLSLMMKFCFDDYAKVFEVLDSGWE